MPSRSSASSLTRTSVGIEICVGRSMSRDPQEHGGDIRPFIVPMVREVFATQQFREVAMRETAIAVHKSIGLRVRKAVARERDRVSGLQKMPHNARFVDAQRRRSKPRVARHLHQQPLPLDELTGVRIDFKLYPGPL